jgi:hypothetical protein
MLIALTLELSGGEAVRLERVVSHGVPESNPVDGATNDPSK